ncbi:hypothetical protein ABW21_db0208162 [Orbilia brochopaga]|nr:hypothetical protein ABW21_db0208162 [Drechslerella brochopaga]
MSVVTTIPVSFVRPDVRIPHFSVKNGSLTHIRRALDLSEEEYDIIGNTINTLFEDPDFLKTSLDAHVASEADRTKFCSTVGDALFAALASEPAFLHKIAVEKSAFSPFLLYRLVILRRKKYNRVAARPPVWKPTLELLPESPQEDTTVSTPVLTVESPVCPPSDFTPAASIPTSEEICQLSENKENSAPISLFDDRSACASPCSHCSIMAKSANNSLTNMSLFENKENNDVVNTPAAPATVATSVTPPAKPAKTPARKAKTAARKAKTPAPALPARKVKTEAAPVAVVESAPAAVVESVTTAPEVRPKRQKNKRRWFKSSKANTEQEVQKRDKKEGMRFFPILAITLTAVVVGVAMLNRHL